MTLSNCSTEHRVGHLVEWRLCSIVEVADLHGLELARAKAVTDGGRETVICVDWRQGEVLKPEVADALTEVWAKQTAAYKRSAILLSKNRPTFNLQIERVIRAVNVGNRRSFLEVPALLGWLGAVLTPDELRRAGEFLGGTDI